MDIQHHHRRLRVGLIALLLGLTLQANAATVSLLRFDFEQSDSLPGPLFLFATPLLGLVAGRWLRRGAQSPSS